MKGDALPDADHILRCVAGSHVDTADDGSAVITGGGFIARPRDDNKPSYNWLECLAGSLADRVQQIRDAARIRYGAKGRLVRLNVGQVRYYVERNTIDRRVVTVVHDPLDAENGKPADPSHSLMTNVADENDPEGELVGDLIRDCVLEIFPARAT